MEISLTSFLLKFIGIFTIIIGFSFFRKENAEQFIEMEKNQGLMLGMFRLIICLPIVILHNIWTGPWEIVVSLMGWSGLLKAINTIVKLPILGELRQKKVEQEFSSSASKYAWFFIVLGFVLLYGGFTN